MAQVPKDRRHTCRLAEQDLTVFGLCFILLREVESHFEWLLLFSRARMSLESMVINRLGACLPTLLPKARFLRAEQDFV